jgi:hypothetical protein
MRSKELSVELRDRIVLRHRTGEGYQKLSAALEVPKNTVASIILKWKKFGTTKTLPRADRPGQTEQSGEKGHGHGGDQEPNDQSVEMGEPSRRTTISVAFHQLGLYDREARQKPLLSKRHDSPL